MKNKIYSLCLMIVVTLMAVGIFSQKTQADESRSGYSMVVKPFLQIDRKFTQVSIVPGDSEFDKREKENVSKQAAAKRSVAPREMPAESVDLGSLRSLYQEAGAKYGVDWKLIEAVHQIETGKSGSTCKQNPSGATGPMQFLPSTFRHYSDGGDICNVHDAVFAAANLLAQSGASSGDIDSALFSYNHSSAYVAKVKQIMQSI